MAAFSGIKLGWEPLLEPWRCRLQFAAPSGAPSAQHPHPQQHQRLSLASTQGLELTVTQTALEAAALAGGALVAAAAVAEDPSLLDAQLEAAGNSAAYSAAYWLHNQTGTSLEVWLAANEEQQAGGCSPGSSPGGSSGGSSSASARYASAGSASGASQGPWLPAGQPELVVRPGGRAALPVVAASSTQQQGLHVGRPSPTQGVLLPHLPGGRGQRFSLVHSASSSRMLAPVGSAVHLQHGHLQSTTTLEGSSSGLAAAAAALQTRPLLFFRLAEQADVCGPLHLDRSVSCFFSLLEGGSAEPADACWLGCCSVCSPTLPLRSPNTDMSCTPPTVQGLLRGLLRVPWRAVRHERGAAWRVHAVTPLGRSGEPGLAASWHLETLLSGRLDRSRLRASSKNKLSPSLSSHATPCAHRP